MSDDDKTGIIHIARAEQDPNIPNVDRCPDHPTLEPESGFGMAGGGMGVYTYCPECMKILSKTQIHD
jgi:hypothetical protein